MPRILSVLLSMRLVAPQQEVSDRETVQQLATKADDAFRRGDVAAARAALLEAIALEPDNMTLVFGLAQAERFLGNCERAVELYDRFLRSGPADAQAQAATEKRAECTDAPPPEPDPAPAQDVVPPPEPAPPTDPAPVTPPPAPTTRPAGPVLVGVGAALTIAGAVLVATAFARAARAPDAATFDDYDRDRTSSRPLAIGGWTALGAGLSLAITGGVVWGVQRKRGRSMLQIEARR